MVPPGPPAAAPPAPAGAVPPPVPGPARRPACPGPAGRPPARQPAARPGTAPAPAAATTAPAAGTPLTRPSSSPVTSACSPSGNVGLDPALHRRQPQLLQPRRLPRQRLHLAHISQRRAPPQPQRLPKTARRGGRLTPAQRRLPRRRPAARTGPHPPGPDRAPSTYPPPRAASAASGLSSARNRDTYDRSVLAAPGGGLPRQTSSTSRPAGATRPASSTSNASTARWPRPAQARSRSPTGPPAPGPAAAPQTPKFRRKQAAHPRQSPATEQAATQNGSVHVLPNGPSPSVMSIDITRSRPFVPAQCDRSAGSHRRSLAEVLVDSASGPLRRHRDRGPGWRPPSRSGRLAVAAGQAASSRAASVVSAHTAGQITAWCQSRRRTMPRPRPRPPPITTRASTPSSRSARRAGRRCPDRMSCGTSRSQPGASPGPRDRRSHSHDRAAWQ